MADPPCGSVHPQYPEVVCESSGSHKSHRCWSGSVWVLWENLSYVPLPKPTPGRKSARKDLADFKKRTGGSQSRAEGMEGSFSNIRDDPHNWPIVVEAVQHACRTNRMVSSNEVWDVLIAREDFTYTGDKGFMGTVLSGWARGQGLVGEKVGKVDNRQPWSHSTEPVNLYPSLVKQSPATG